MQAHTRSRSPKTYTDPLASTSVHGSTGPDKRGGDSTYVHCNLNDHGDAWELERLSGNNFRIMVAGPNKHKSVGKYLSAHGTTGTDKFGDSTVVHVNTTDYGDQCTIEPTGQPDTYSIVLATDTKHGVQGKSQKRDSRSGDSTRVHVNNSEYGNR